MLVSDNGKQFDNNAFNSFCSELGIRNHYSSPAYPQANGQVEVTNRTLLKIIKTRFEGGKGYLAKRTAKRLMGISDDCKDTHRGDPVSTCIQSRCSHPSRDRPYQLSSTELHGGQKRRSYAPSARLGRRGPSNSRT